MRLTLLLYFCFFLFQTGDSQEINIFNIQSDKGLICSEIHDIDQDSTGFMWFATGLGLFKYDGSDFEFYTSKNGLTHSVVFDIFIDVTNRIWLSTYKGGICYFENDTIKEYLYNKTLINLIDSVGLFDTHINDFVYDNNELFFTLTKSPGIYKIDSNGLGCFIDLPNKKAALFSRITHNGVLPGLIKTSHDVDCNLKINDTAFSYSNSVEDFNPKSNVLIDSTFISVGHRIFKKENNKIVFNKSIDNAILALKIDDQQNLWIGAKSGGLLFFSKGDLADNSKKEY